MCYLLVFCCIKISTVATAGGSGWRENGALVRQYNGPSLIQ